MKAEIKEGDVRVNYIQLFRKPFGFYVSVDTDDKWPDVTFSDSSPRTGVVDAIWIWFYPMPGADKRSATIVMLKPTNAAERKLFNHHQIARCSSRYGGTFIIAPWLTGKEHGTNLYDKDDNPSGKQRRVNSY